MNHWIDNADSYVCPICGFETDNPNRYKSARCPRCGFQDVKDLTMKVMKKLNLNCIIKVKLTDCGKDVFYHQYDELNKYIIKCGGEPIKPRFPDVDSEGFSQFQLWDFMHVYGKHMMMAAPNVIEPLNIYIDDGDLEE